MTRHLLTVDVTVIGSVHYSDTKGDSSNSLNHRRLYFIKKLQMNGKLSRQFIVFYFINPFI